MPGALTRLVERVLGIDAARRAIVRAHQAVQSDAWRQRESLGIISDHGQKQMIGRYICRPEKIEKVVEKAWRSKQTSKRMRRKAAREPWRTFRLFSGFVFVFAQGRRGITLVTVIRPGVK